VISASAVCVRPLAARERPFTAPHFGRPAAAGRDDGIEGTSVRSDNRAAMRVYSSRMETSLYIYYYHISLSIAAAESSSCW